LLRYDNRSGVCHEAIALRYSFSCHTDDCWLREERIAQVEHSSQAAD
jgi:hypothetical protein